MTHFKWQLTGQFVSVEFVTSWFYCVGLFVVKPVHRKLPVTWVPVRHDGQNPTRKTQPTWLPFKPCAQNVACLTSIATTYEPVLNLSASCQDHTFWHRGALLYDKLHTALSHRVYTFYILQKLFIWVMPIVQPFQTRLSSQFTEGWHSTIYSREVWMAYKDSMMHTQTHTHTLMNANTHMQHSH